MEFLDFNLIDEHFGMVKTTMLVRTHYPRIYTYGTDISRVQPLLKFISYHYARKIQYDKKKSLCFTIFHYALHGSP